MAVLLVRWLWRRGGEKRLTEEERERERETETDRQIDTETKETIDNLKNSEIILCIQMKKSHKSRNNEKSIK